MNLRILLVGVMMIGTFSGRPLSMPMPDPQVTSSATAQQPGPSLASETGTQFYSRYMEAIRSAKSKDDILLPFVTAKVAELFRTDPRMTLDDVRWPYAGMTDVKVVKEAGTDSSKTLDLEASYNGQARHGVATLVREGGVWKLSSEKWEPLPR